MLDPTGRNNKLSYRPLINSSVFWINKGRSPSNVALTGRFLCPGFFATPAALLMTE
jgi:hypothetical protein